VAKIDDIDPELRRSMDASLKAFSAGDDKFFDYLSDSVTVFSVNSAEPTRSRDEFRRSFGEAFRARKVDVISQDIDARDDRAVLLQTLEVTTDNVTSYVRQTVIWEPGKDGWKMSHIHNAQVGAALLTGQAPRDLASIRVLNERIATVAATVGVAQ
jgi:hypothetical protein